MYAFCDLGYKIPTFHHKFYNENNSRKLQNVFFLRPFLCSFPFKMIMRHFFYYSEEILVIYSATTLYHFIWLPTHRKWSMHANWSNICLFSLVFQLFYTFKMTWLPVGFALKQVIFLEDRKPLVDNNEHCLLFNAVSY